MVRRLKVFFYHRVFWCRLSFVLSFCHSEVQSVKIWARSRPERQTHKQKKDQKDRHTNRKMPKDINTNRKIQERQTNKHISMKKPINHN